MNPITFSRKISANAEKIWQLLTNPELMKIWYFTVHNFQLQEGSEFYFYENETGGEFLHRCKILKVTPGKIFEHTWEYPEIVKGVSVVKWELKALEENLTLVTLTHSGTEQFAEAGAMFRRESFEQGWYEILLILRNKLHKIENLSFEKEINASPSNVWKALWDRNNYTQWTQFFSEGSQLLGNLEKNAKILLVDGSKNGMYSEISDFEENSKLVMKHLGMVENGKELPIDAEAEKWTETTESYFLTPFSGGTLLRVEVQMTNEHKDFMEKAFKPALEEVKKIAENQV